MTQPDADSTDTRLQRLTDRFDDFVEETRSNREADNKKFDDFVEETRRNREADNKKFDNFVEETRRNREEDTKRFDEIDEVLKELRDDSARFKGRDYERLVSHTLLSPVSRRLGLRRPRLVHSAAYGTSDELSIRLEDHMEQQDLLEVMLSDAIVRGTHQGEPAYAVVEISVTLGDRDITRAADRAERLEKASKVRTFPVAIGQNIPEQQETQANDMNVTLIQIGE